MGLKTWCLQKSHWGTLVLNVPPVQWEQPSGILAQKNQDQSGIRPFSSSFIQYLWPRPHWTPTPAFSCPVFFHQVHFRLSLIPSCVTRGRQLSFAPGCVSGSPAAPELKGSPKFSLLRQAGALTAVPRGSPSVHYFTAAGVYRRFWDSAAELRSHERPEYFLLSEKETAPSSRGQAAIGFTNVRLLVSPALLQPSWLPC